MSAENLRKQMQKIQDEMDDDYHYIEYTTLTPLFLKDTNQLHQIYGEFVGKAKAIHPEERNQITSLDNEITQYFNLINKFIDEPKRGLTLISSASGKISELISYINALESKPPQENVSKSSYDKLLNQRNELKKTIEIMVQYKGLPELNTLMETAKNHSLPLDEYWVLALCSSNLIEAVVNKKLEQLKEKTDGNFEERYKKLCKVIKEKEGRDISQLLPSAIYKVRNKLDHSDFNIITPKEAKDINKMVIDFMNEVFQ